WRWPAGPRARKISVFRVSTLERVYGGGQIDVLLGHRVLVMGFQRDLNAVIAVGPVGVMAGLFRKQRDAGHEAEGGAEIVEIKAPRNGAFAVAAPAVEPGKGGVEVEGLGVGVHFACP